MKIRSCVLFVIPLVLNACAYKFNGASTTGLKTIVVKVFENNAPIVVPTLSNQITEALKTRIRNQTSLGIIKTEADAIFEGRITGYDIKPVALQAGPTPSSNAQRLTITVSVKFKNNIKDQEKASFEESFSRFLDFPVSGGAIPSPSVIENINKQLTEDIFNRAFAQW